MSDLTIIKMFIYSFKWLSILALQVPPLVRHPETRELYLNLDPCVFQVIQEAHSMIKMKLEVPNVAKLLLHSQQRLRNHYDELCALLNQDRIIREKVPTLSGTLFSTSLKKVSLFYCYNCELEMCYMWKAISADQVRLWLCVGYAALYYKRAVS